MSVLQAKVEALRQSSANHSEDKRAMVRAAMPADMVRFVEGWKAIDPEMKLAHLVAPGLTLGQPGARGLPLRNLVLGPIAFAKKGAR